jgi:hypothetical protein
MPLQDPNILSMVGLGTLHELPPNPLQPKLVNAIHLRWAFRPDLGFPWHGFYLYRRNSKRETGPCIGAQLAQLPVGPLNTNSWNSGIGIITSDQPLVATDDFPAAGVAEFDLAGRTFIEFIPLQIAYSVEIQIGFRKNPQRHPRCLDFAQMRPQSLANPYQRLGIDIQTLDGAQKPTPHNEIVTTSVTGHATSAMLLGALTLIKTDEKVNVIDVWLISAKKAVVQAQDSAAKKILGKLSIEVGSQVQHYRLEGNGLHDTRISLDGPGYLLAVCVDSDALRQITELSVTAFGGGKQVAQVIVAGAEGDVVTASLSGDIIDKVQISGGFASLINLCWANAIRDAQSGWQPVDGVKQPIALPVLHPDYPASGNLPTDLPTSRTLALSRIRYGDPSIWKTPFDDIHEQCLNLVKGGPAIPMNSPSRAVTFPAVVDPGDTSTPPSLPQQQPLQLLLLASMHAPIAQMLGLYWSDTTAIQGETYDYLIVADHAGAAGHDALHVLGLIQSQGFVELDGYIVFGKQVGPATPLAPPTDLRSYALPGTTRPDLSGGVIDSSCNAGFRWNLPLVNNVLLPESPVLYHLWRFAYGPTEPSNQADPSKFKAVNPDDPLLIVENMLTITGVQRPQDWPPFPLFGFDNALDEGWYGYRVSNIDIFGRHSALGQPAQWFEWSPTPDPKPWYYVDPPADAAVHPFAIGLLDKMPPPPPTGVEAFALDPGDPFLQRDAAYVDWFATLSSAEKASVIGLRVRWNWTQALMRQAPDAKEFRIYYQSGRLNSLLGQTTSVSAANSTESLVQTDIPNSQTADAFVGCSLKIGPYMFTIVGSDVGSPLHIRVKNIGPLKDIAPANRANCEVNIPNNHPLFVDYGVALPWEERYYVVDFNEHVTVGVDDAGNPLRIYEIFLPASGDAFRGGLALNPDLAEPIKLAAIGVSTSDNRSHTADDPKWAAGRFGGRTGNEGPMSPAAIVFRVLREKPVPPVPPPDSDRVFATPADYHAASFYTFRWQPQAHLKTHVYRAMDDTVFNVDWSFQPRAPISPNDLSVFPSEAVEARWNFAKRQEVADELNVLNTFPHTDAGKEQARKYYRGLSNDGLRVLPNLPNNESAFVQVTISSLDPDDPATSNRVGPDNPPDFVVDSSLRIYIDTLDGRSTNRFFYKACYVDGAQNRSALSLSGPPIWLPKVVPPKPPTFTKVLAGDANPANPGDNKVTLRWASNREEDLAEYRIYRAMDQAAARSIRSMTLVHALAVAPGDPALRPAQNVWTDHGLSALQWIYYRMTAVDTAGNESLPNDAVTARAFDEALPTVPTLIVAWVPVPDNDARAQWTATTETRLERRAATELIWENATDWLPPGSHTFDDSIDEHFPWKFRLRARKSTGAVAVGPAVNLLRK